MGFAVDADLDTVPADVKDPYLAEIKCEGEERDFVEVDVGPGALLKGSLDPCHWPSVFVDDLNIQLVGGFSLRSVEFHHHGQAHVHRSWPLGPEQPRNASGDHEQQVVTYLREVAQDCCTDLHQRQAGVSSRAARLPSRPIVATDPVSTA